MTCRCKSVAEHCARYDEAAQESSRQHDVYLTRNAETAEREIKSRLAELQARTPDPDTFSIEDVEVVGNHLVLKVKYPSCTKCAFDQCKVMVLLDTSIKNALKWKRIDPHFSDKKSLANHAPSPAARFPASPEGWQDALDYAKRKGGLS